MQTLIILWQVVPQVLINFVPLFVMSAVMYIVDRWGRASRSWKPIIVVLIVAAAVWGLVTSLSLIDWNMMWQSSGFVS